MLAMAGLLALGACGGSDIPPLRDDGSVEPPDAGIDARTECPDPEPPPAECDFFLSCGCDVGAGEKCSVNPENSMRDCFQAGTTQAGQACVEETDCEAGTLCAVFGDSGARRCMKFCDDEFPCPTTPVAQACYIPVFNVEDARVCGQVCDLLGQDCELDDQACYPSGRVTTAEKGICAEFKLTGVNGASCTVANDCNTGLTCLSNDGKCHELCDRQDGDPGCTTGTCQEIPGHTRTGVCK
jgi:hypothetical protein